MNISQAAQKLKCKPIQIINELTKKFPEKTWKPDTELPEQFVAEMEKHTNEYLESESGSVPSEVPGEMSEELVKKRNAISASRIAADAVQYGILEALVTQETEMSEFFGIATALQGIESFQNAHSRTWELFYQQKQRILSSRIQEIQGQIVSNATIREQEMGKRSQTLLENALKSQKEKEVQRKELQVLVDAFIGSSTN